MKGDSSSGFSITLERAKGYTYPTDTLNLDTARQMALALLEHDSVKTDVGKRMDLLRLLTDVARMGLDYEEQVKWASQLAMLCREQGDETEALRTESEIGIVLTHLGQRWEGLAMLDKSIARLEPQRHFAELDACIIAMKRKLTALSLLPSITMPEDSVTSELRYHSIISLAERFVAKLDDYEQHPDDYADGSPQQPDSDEVAGYCDFYRSQAYVFLAQAYASTGNRKEAEKYTRMFGQSDFGQTLNGRSAITETQRLLGDYDKMLATYDEIDRQAGDDTLNTNYVRQLRGRAEAAEARGQHALSQHYWQRHSALSEAVNDQLQASEAHDYAARYHAYEQQMEIQQREAEANRNLILAVGAIILALLAAGFAVYYFRQQRIIRKKNRVLVEQMNEAVIYKKRYESQDTPQVPQEDKPLDAMAPNELSKHLRAVILRERLYLSAQFDRQAAIDYFHLSKERIGAAFSQDSEYATIADFINHCRLEYASDLLATSPDMTVDDIASASGFGTRRTFSRLFKERYSVTPTEFRNQIV
jgi:AraC-like DNA-binding protein